jgi:hypothetical protein
MGPNRLIVVFAVIALFSLLFLLQDRAELFVAQKSVSAIGEEDDYDDNDDISDSTQMTAEDDIDHPDLVAPRSHPGPYNEYVPGNKYLIYSPSGGFSNQRMEIEYAMEIGKLLNRTVYVPMCGRHTNGWVHYNSLRGDDLFPMDRILDFPFLRTYDKRIHLVPLNITVSSFVSRFQKDQGPESVYSVMGLRKYSGRSDVLRWRSVKEPLLFFRAIGFYHPWFFESTMEKVRGHVRFTSYLRELAVKVANQALGSQFYAMHIRMGDYAYRRIGDSSTYVVRARELNWRLNDFKIYIATEPGHDEEYFAPLEAAGKIVYSQDLPKEIVQDFKNAFPKGKIRSDMVGLLEQLIAAQAKSFIGTYFSTFSAYIQFMREHKGALFPEIAHIQSDSDGSAEGKMVSNSTQPEDDTSN